MLQKEKPDVVGIGPNRKTYSAHRLEMIRAAAEVGAHVMVDKPHARSLEEADQIIALAEKHKIKGVVYHPVRVAPLAATLGLKWKLKGRQQLHFSVGRSLRGNAAGGPRARIYAGWRWDF